MMACAAGERSSEGALALVTAGPQYCVVHTPPPPVLQSPPAVSGATLCGDARLQYSVARPGLRRRSRLQHGCEHGNLPIEYDFIARFRRRKFIARFARMKANNAEDSPAVIAPAEASI